MAGVAAAGVTEVPKMMGRVRTAIRAQCPPHIAGRRVRIALVADVVLQGKAIRAGGPAALGQVENETRLALFPAVWEAQPAPQHVLTIASAAFPCPWASQERGVISTRRDDSSDRHDETPGANAVSSMTDGGPGPAHA